MAKIRARKGSTTTRQIGPTFFTERLRKASFEGDTDRVYYEAWRLRSDGWIQTRIIKTWDPANRADETVHRGSAFTNWRRFKDQAPTNAEGLVKVLERLKADVVKQSY